LVQVCRGAIPEPYWLIIRLRRCLATWAWLPPVAFRSARCCASARLVEVDLLPQAQQLDGGAARIAAILGERSVVVR